jgi:BMFP domain-containing protein YqiC
MSGTTRTKTTSYSESHYKLLEQSAKEHHIGFSRTVRLLIDFALDQDPDLGLPILIDERNAVRAQLAALDASITDLEAKKKTRKTEAPKTVFEGVTNQVTSESSRASPSATPTDSRPEPTAEELFLKQAPYVAREEFSDIPEIKRRVLDQASKHHDWLEKVPEPDRSRLEAMLKKPRVGGSS